MPFKTRKHKQSASTRRFAFSASGLVSYEGKANTRKNQDDLRREVSEKSIDDLSYVRSDILKIIFAASVIIAAQLALSLTLP